MVSCAFVLSHVCLLVAGRGELLFLPIGGGMRAESSSGTCDAHRSSCFASLRHMVGGRRGRVDTQSAAAWSSGVLLQRAKALLHSCGCELPYGCQCSCLRWLVGRGCGCLVGWLAGWLVGWLVGRLVGWLVGLAMRIAVRVLPVFATGLRSAAGVVVAAWSAVHMCCPMCACSSLGAWVAFLAHWWRLARPITLLVAWRMGCFSFPLVGAQLEYGEVDAGRGCGCMRGRPGLVSMRPACFRCSLFGGRQAGWIHSVQLRGPVGFCR